MGNKVKKGWPKGIPRGKTWNKGLRRPLVITERDIQRFWSKVEQQGQDECWPWKASRVPEGYGQMYWFGRPRKSSRIAWWITYGDPGELNVLHTCDNTECCNPNHLFLGTQTDNLNDMWGKDRGQHGRSHYKAKLTESDVCDIRILYRRGWRLFELARKYGVHRMNIKSIVTYKTWKRARQWE